MKEQEFSKRVRQLGYNVLDFGDGWMLVLGGCVVRNGQAFFSTYTCKMEDALPILLAMKVKE